MLGIWRQLSILSIAQYFIVAWLCPGERGIPMNGARPVRYLMVLLLFALTLFVTPDTPSVRAALASASAAKTPGIATSAPGNVTYHDGSVMAGTMNVYAIFWQPAGSVVDPNYNNLIMQYYNDVGGSGLYTLMNQYTQNDGGAPTSALLADSWVDANPYPGSGNLTQQQIIQEIQTAMQKNGWKAGPSNYFAVYTAEGIADKGDCGYHSVVPADTIILGYIPYPAGTCLVVPKSPNNCQICDSAISISAHEQFEAATDPFYYTSQYGSPGWYYQTTTGEIADLCTYPFYSTFQFGTLLYDNGNANESWNGHFYLIQEMWDNGANGGKGGCSQGSQTAEYPIPTSDSGTWGIARGPDGNLWFTEGIGKIGKITPDGAITEYPVPTPNSGPVGITTGPDGNLWFTEFATGQIGRITPSGAITEYPIPTFGSEPDGITAGPAGTLWFTEYQANQIGRLSPGESVARFGGVHSKLHSQ